ncbi:MAG: sel1 repeat family protein [Alphaproteobacteria bacterium]|nr:sel1 repeat family protein [Alphaproteobacteria bacterium]
MLGWFVLTALAQDPAAGPESTGRVEVVFQEKVPLPDDFAGERPAWKTNRFAQPLLVDAEEKVFALDEAGRMLHRVDSEPGLESYHFPMKYFERWKEPWVVVDGASEVGLDRGPDFTGAFLATRWGSDGREALVRLDRKALAVYSVTPPPAFVDYPTCFASVPESCLASAMTILKEHAGDAKAARVARAQVKRACDDGVVRACFVGVTLDGGKLAAPARACLDDDANACATVAGSVYAEAKLKGESSKAGERMLEHACNAGVPGACTEAAQMFDERELPHNALLMLDRACVSGDRASCDEVELRRDRAFATGIAKACLKDAPDPVGCITLAQFLEEKPLDDLGIDAFGAWKKACAGGEDPACRAMAPYVDRWGVDDPRVQEATTGLLTDCDGGKTEACVGAAHLLVRLDTRDPRYGRARELYAKACEAGANTGCLAGAAQSWAGTAKRLELPDAEALYRTACDRDSAQACAGLGRVLADAKRTSDAVPPLEKGCDLGSASACTQLGKLVQMGKHSMDTDPTEIFRKGCDEGDAEACYELGRKLAGKSTAAPGSDAFDAFRTACDGGQLGGCEQTGLTHLSLGTHYEAGIAATYLEPACEGGRTDSCRELGLMYRRGNGVQRDPRRGRQLLVKAGELEPVRHVRIGGRIGFLNILGVDGELVLPIPIGPAVSVGGDFSFLPGKGLSMVYLGPTVRIYPSHSARGLYAAAGWHQFRINAKGEITTNAGFNGRVGVRVQQSLTWGGVEIGLASVDAPRVRDLIKPIPLVVPVFGVSGGVAFL